MTVIDDLQPRRSRNSQRHFPQSGKLTISQRGGLRMRNAGVSRLSDNKPGFSSGRSTVVEYGFAEKVNMQFVNARFERGDDDTRAVENRCSETPFPR